MNPSKKSGSWHILSIVAMVALILGSAFVFLSRPPEKNVPAPDSSQVATAQRPGTTQQPATEPGSGIANTAAATHTLAASPTPATPRQPTSALSSSAHPQADQSTATAATSASASGAANPADTPSPASPVDIAALSPREHAILEKIPSARFREDVLSLAPAARTRAFKALAAKPIPDADYASLHVTSKGLLYYACEFLAAPAPRNDNHADPKEIFAPAGNPENLAAALPISQPPVRHSRPGAQRILFLDFGGMDVKGTIWNEATKTRAAVTVYRARPYDIDATPDTFSEQEQQNIIKIWELVAEDFAPFDVDVTTEKPSAFNRTTGHALITRSTDNSYPTQTMPSGETAGGVGLLNVFGDEGYEIDASPVFIYYDSLSYSTDNIAYAISHELGHNLGLSHDGPGLTLGDGDDNGYYTGHGTGNTSWAPIMGAGYGNKMIQWSKGEYYGANNKEDDLLIIEGKLGYRGALATTTLATAASLAPLEDGLLGATGILRHAADAHYYAINLSTSGSISFALKPCTASGAGNIIGNTDLKLEILNSSGILVTATNPPSETYASLGRQLSAGEWYVRVTSTGAGTPMSIFPSGYTAYGSIGQYTLGTNLVYSRPPLATALNSNLTWTAEPGSAAGWFGQTTTTHDNIAAAQSGPIDQNQSTGILTTVEGPGTVSFWWKISAGASDYLTFATTDAASGTTAIRANISGQRDWEQRTLAIENTGTHTFGWTFDRAPIPGNPSPTTTGSAWVDQVVWIPDNVTFHTTPATKEISSGTGQFTFAVETNKTWTATADAPWLTVTPSSGTGNATLAIAHEANDTPSPRHGAITIKSAGINRACEISQPPRIPLSAALNNTLAWETGGDNEWTTQTINTHDGQHAARSGLIFGVLIPDPDQYKNTGQETWIQTKVEAPGTLSFWWKVSSEAEATDETGTWGDILYFTVNGMERARASGEQDWAQRTFTITGTGIHTLKWRYKKDPYLSAFGDAAWLDQVIWTTGTAVTLGISPQSKQTAPTSSQFTIAVDSNIAWNASTAAAWLTVSPTSGNGPATLNVTCATNSVSVARTGVITVTGAGLTDTCTITQAAATSGTGNNNNNNNNKGGGGGGGGGAPSLWILGALGLLLLIRAKRFK